MAHPTWIALTDFPSSKRVDCIPTANPAHIYLSCVCSNSNTTWQYSGTYSRHRLTIPRQLRQQNQYSVPLLLLNLSSAAHLHPPKSGSQNYRHPRCNTTWQYSGTYSRHRLTIPRQLRQQNQYSIPLLLLNLSSAAHLHPPKSGSQNYRHPR